jgi:hypothetical protein
MFLMTTNSLSEPHRILTAAAPSQGADREQRAATHDPRTADRGPAKEAETLRSLSDEALLRRLSELLRDTRANEAPLVAHLAEVDERRLYARFAVSSLFTYCTQVLHFSEGEAGLRIAVARASRRHPVLLDVLAHGRIHLSGLAMLAPHLTIENRDALLARATHRTKSDIEELLAEVRPRPDVPERVRKLPERRIGQAVAALDDGGAAHRDGAEEPRPGANGREGSPALGVAVAAAPPCAGTTLGSPVGGDRFRADPGPHSVSRLPLPEEVTSPREQPRPAGHSARELAGAIEPLAAGRYRIQFTASAELREKLERLQDMMGSSGGGASLAAVIEAAVSEKLQRLEARRRGLTSKPRKTVAASETGPGARYITAAVRRAVWARDQGRCRFVDVEGRRCTARRRLQFHHRQPYGLGGDRSVGNISLRCPLHNKYLAEIDYGRATVAAAILRSRDSTPH